jgi:hypothetical protein
MGSIASKDRSAMQVLNKKVMIKKDKQQGGIAKWALYINGNSRAGQH